MNPWINAEVLKIKKWTKSLFSIFLKAPISNFQAGQFTKLALYTNNEKKKFKEHILLLMPQVIKI